MKITIMYTVLLIAPILLNGQINSSVDFVTGIEFSYRTLHASNDDFVSGLILETREKEVQKINWRVGFNYNKKLTKKGSYDRIGYH